MNRARFRRVAVFATVVGRLLAQSPAATGEPRLTSIYPLTLERGKTQIVEIRGSAIFSAKSVLFRDSTIPAKVLGLEPEADQPTAKEKFAIVRAEITPSVDASVGPKKLRVFTAEGASNEIEVRLSADPVMLEGEGSRKVARFPALISGRIANSAEADDYWFDAAAGQTLTFEAASGSKTLDPSLTLYEPSGSWFDAKRLNRLAFNDESVSFPAMTKDARLSHRFEKAGKYCVRVQGFAGQGGPDGVYELRIFEGKPEAAPLRPQLQADWEEHELTRSLTGDWMSRVAARSGTNAEVPQPERYRAVAEGSAEIPVMKIPGVVEGVLNKPGESHVIRINIDKAQEVAIEVETPSATMPGFTPIVRLLEPGGAEIVGNVYTRLNNNNFQMMKSIKAKAAVPLAAPGVYTLRIRELTTDHAGEDFRYRVLVRRQIPHLGKLAVKQERINLERGATQPISVRMEREEGFTGMVAVQVENLPPGVTALPGVENPDDRPPLPNAGKPERYQPRVQTISLMLAASADAALQEAPAYVRLVARPVRDGRMGDVIASADVPLSVVEKK